MMHDPVTTTRLIAAYEKGKDRDRSVLPLPTPEEGWAFERGLRESLIKKPICASHLNVVLSLTLEEIEKRFNLGSDRLSGCPECDMICESPAGVACPNCSHGTMHLDDWFQDRNPMRTCEAAGCGYPFLEKDALAGAGEGSFLCPRCGAISE